MGESLPITAESKDIQKAVKAVLNSRFGTGHTPEERRSSFDVMVSLLNPVDNLMPGSVAEIGPSILGDVIKGFIKHQKPPI